jgi:hypothetical protein
VKLWHDDIRIPPRGWVWALNNDAAKAALETLKVTDISMDHDLGGKPGMDHNVKWVGEETGYDLVNWMIEMGIYPHRINVHSWSASGGTRMHRALIAARHPTSCIITRVPYDPNTMV